MRNKNYLECGKIQNTHGCHGWVKVQSYCDSPEILASLPCVYFLENGHYIARRILDTGRKQDTVLMQLEGVDDMDAAELLKNQMIYASREDIPLEEGAYFLADLAGLPVVDVDNGKRYGTVKDVDTSGVRDMLTVQTENGVRLLPLVDPFVIRVDVEDAVYVRPIPGLLEDI